jgi:hypothetical protein
VSGTALFPIIGGGNVDYCDLQILAAVGVWIKEGSGEGGCAESRQVG